MSDVPNSFPLVQSVSFIDQIDLLKIICITDRYLKTTNLVRIAASNFSIKYRSTVDHIYQPLRSGRIWHKVNF